MFSNYIRTALRNLKRHLGYMILNVGGLAVGLAYCDSSICTFTVTADPVKSLRYE